jgi:hypothetical protein
MNLTELIAALEEAITAWENVLNGNADHNSKPVLPDMAYWSEERGNVANQFHA